MPSNMLLNWVKKIKKTDCLLVLLWLLAFIIINPIGEFPINDDWAYTKNVYNLAVKHIFVVDQFPAMNLISQTVYGTVVVWLFGFSFFVLRLSIVLLSIFASISFKKIIYLLSNNNDWFSFYITAFVFFNPLFLSLSFTFMTDMFFVSMLIFAFLNFYKYSQTEKIKYYLLYLFFTLIAVLNRQHGLLISLLSLSLIIKETKNIKLYLLILVPPILTWLVHDEYRHYLTKNSIAHGIQYSNDLLHYLKTANLKDHFQRAGDSLLVVGGTLIPVIIIIASTIKNHFSKTYHWIVLLLLSGITFYLISFDVDFYPLGNISTILEVGPKAIKTNTNVVYSESITYYRTIIMFFSAISIVIFFSFILKQQSALLVKNKLLYYIIISVIIIFFLFISISKAYFDRYTIPMIVLLCITLIPYEIKINKVGILFFSAYLALLYLVSVFEIKDYFNWQTTRWKALEILNTNGVSANKIDGGFEYNGWYKPNKNYSDEGKSWWWVDDDQYVVTTAKLPNYNIDTFYVYQKYIPYTTDTVLVLKKNNQINMIGTQD